MAELFQAPAQEPGRFCSLVLVEGSVAEIQFLTHLRVGSLDFFLSHPQQEVLLEGRVQKPQVEESLCCRTDPGPDVLLASGSAQ